MSGASFQALLQNLEAAGTTVDDEGTGQKVMYQATLMVDLPANQLAAFVTLVNKQGILNLAATPPDGAWMESDVNKDFLNP